MPREKPGYRAQLELIRERFPDHEILTVSEVAAYTGWSREKARRALPFMDFAGQPSICLCPLYRPWRALRGPRSAAKMRSSSCAKPITNA